MIVSICTISIKMFYYYLVFYSSTNNLCTHHAYLVYLCQDICYPSIFLISVFFPHTTEWRCLATNENAHAQTTAIHSLIYITSGMAS